MTTRRKGSLNRPQLTKENNLTMEMEESQTRCQETVKAIENEITMDIELFGNVRTFDPSHFKPRGHYERDEVLRAIQDVVRTQRLVQ